MDNGQCLKTGGPSIQLVGGLFVDHNVVCTKVDDGCAAVVITTNSIEFAFARR